jgi:Carbohydrate family 9 binding domain-like
MKRGTTVSADALRCLQPQEYGSNLTHQQLVPLPQNPMKLTLLSCAVLCALASNIPLGLSAVAQNSVSITLGTTNVSNGLFLNETDGGWTIPVTAGGSQARSTTPPAGKTGQFMYFATDPAFANNGSVSKLWVTVEYFDQGTDAFKLEYDAQPDPNNINIDTDPYTVSNGAENNGLIYKYDTKQWLSYTFVLNNVWFGKRQPGNSDFRIDDWTIDNNGNPVDNEGPEIIRKVTVSKTEPTAFHIKYATIPIKLDGVLDDPAWQTAQTFLLNRAAQDVIRPSVWKGTNDYSAVCRFAWDTDYLYASFDVTDDVIRVSLDDPSQAWNGDGAEIFFGFDQSNPSRTAYLPATDFHIMMSAGPNPTYEIADLAGITFTNTPGIPFPPSPSDVLVVKDRAAGLPSGYVLEARIPWTLLIDPTLGVTNTINPGQLVGFSIFGNDGDNPAAPAQEKALSLTERPGPSNNPSSWDTVQMDGPEGSSTITNITITSIKVNGDKLDLSFTTPKPASTHAIEETPKLPASSWTDLTNVTFSSAPGNTLVATFAKPSSSPALYRVRLGNKPVVPTCVTTPALDSWVNTSFTNQTGNFTAQFDATPSTNLIDGVMGLSSGAQTAFTSFGCLARFSTAGVIDARNGGAYTNASVIPYSANVQYSFRFVVNIPNHTSSVYVTPAGGTEQIVGTDFAFRTEQNTVTNLNNFGATLTSSGAAGSNTVCNFRITASTPACITTLPSITSWVNTPFPNQTNTFTATFDATPSEGAPLDVVMALSSGPRTNFPDFACLVRFQTAGIIDARNGANYEGPATDIPFSANVSYHFRLVVNIPAQTYSVYVTPAGGTELLVGQDFAFRPTAISPTNLNNWGIISDIEGSATVCNFKVVSP